MLEKMWSDSTRNECFPKNSNAPEMDNTTKFTATPKLIHILYMFNISKAVFQLLNPLIKGSHPLGFIVKF